MFVLVKRIEEIKKGFQQKVLPHILIYMNKFSLGYEINIDSSKQEQMQKSEKKTF